MLPINNTYANTLMEAKLVTCLVFALTLSGCVAYDSADYISRSVRPHPNHKGMYLVYYRHHKLINDYGPGVDSVRENIKKTEDPEEQLAKWDLALAIAVPKYLDTNNLVPDECDAGINIVSSLADEAGGGTTAFRCK